MTNFPYIIIYVFIDIGRQQMIQSNAIFKKIETTTKT